MIIKNGVLEDVEKQDIRFFKEDPTKAWEGIGAVASKANTKISKEGVVVPKGIEIYEDKNFKSSEYSEREF